MARPSSPVWLVRGDGTRLAIPPSGLLLGGSAACDVILGSDAAPIEAIVWARGGSAHVAGIGPSPVLVNGRECGPSTGLSDGDSLHIGGEPLTVRSEVPGHEAPLLVLCAGGGEFGLRSLPMTIGGSLDDTLSNPGWPHHAGRFEADGDQIVLVVGAPGRIDGEEVVAGSRVPVRAGLSVTLGTLQFDIRLRSVAEALLPSHLRLKIRPRGSELGVWRTPAEQGPSVALSELRVRLLATLLRAGPGVEVADETVIIAVWGRAAVRTRLDVNQLVLRTRRALARAGLPGTAMLVRTRSGGATVIRLAPGATVEIG